jgi:hypothetical protein
MKHLLIITGPQGSGNHLFSRILSQHADVQGWDAMLEQYWVPSDQEPFAEYWIDPDRMQSSHFDGLDYHLANVSCPFFFDGVRHVPDIVGVARRAESFGVQVKIAIIVRDQNINQVQQLRVRGAHTTPVAQEYYYNTLIPSGFPVHFLDHEAFFLHRQHYMAWVGKMLDFPVSTDPDVLNQFISQDANHKYIKYIDEHWLDELILAGCKPTRNERLNDTPGN